MKFFLFSILLHFAFQSVQSTSNNLVNLNRITHALIDTDSMTVSGISSGGFMSIMLHYMYSSKFKAAGSFAGGPFGILYNVSHRYFIPAYAVNVAFIAVPLLGHDRTAADLEQQAIALAAKGLIDPITNLNGSKSYVFQGGVDPINPPVVFNMSGKASEMYKYFGSDLKKKNIPEATHCVPTNYFGLYNCPLFNPFSDGVNNCDYQGVFDMFSHFYGPNYVAPKNIPLTLSFDIPSYSGTFYMFSQVPYYTTAAGTSTFMNENGGIYIPSNCVDPTTTCKLHVALHGCLQSLYSNTIDDVYAKATGYFQVADKNKVIIVFPRAAPFEVNIQVNASNVLTNGQCWDWFGLTTYSAALKDLPQVQAIAAILNTIIGHTVFTM